MVTFRTNSHRDIDMFTSDAHTMLKLMGLSTTVPSALKADDVPAALERLKEGIERHEAIQPKPEPADEEDDEDEDDDKKDRVALHVRAMPLIDLLQAAARANEHVIWE